MTPYDKMKGLKHLECPFKSKHSLRQWSAGCIPDLINRVCRCGSVLNRHIFYRVLKLMLCLSFFYSCSQKEPLFTLLPAEKTHIDFVNRIEDTDTLNILDYLYYYNGGGVAIGDINNDGLPDIYFSSNLGSNKLYLNKGNLSFEDITDKAGVAGKGNWKTGVTIVDVNGDGLQDIYVCEVGKYKNLHGRNELFINNGQLGFTESAHEYELDDFLFAEAWGRRACCLHKLLRANSLAPMKNCLPLTAWLNR